MESNRKRKGLMKAKIVMSFYRAVKPSSTMQYTTKVKPCPPPTLNTSVGYIVSQDQVIPQPKQKVSSSIPSVGYIFDQDQVISQTKQKVSFSTTDNGLVSYGKFDSPYGVTGDEMVDIKAASYISCVQERFRLERVNSERN